ncbi:hypothetical protein AB4156_01120 [Cupriavidus sp. 2MCAB6]|uniref:hypothetical protein n=1 Tax=Cupriavidus sp. 2MCAB6 TaxID=3232981 RepID=UPI003F91079A
MPGLVWPARAGTWQGREEAASTQGELKLEAAGQSLTAAPDDAYWQARPQAARRRESRNTAQQALTAAA